MDNAGWLNTKVSTGTNSIVMTSRLIHVARYKNIPSQIPFYPQLPAAEVLHLFSAMMMRKNLHLGWRSRKEKWAF